MKLYRNGGFTKVIKFSSGFSHENKLKLNEDKLLELNGFIVEDGVIQTMDALARIDTSGISASFPYPQLFNLTNFVLICTDTSIYEYNESTGTLTEKIEVTEGSTWSVVDFHDFIYLTNGSVNVLRDVEDGTYSLSTTIPTGMALCNNNGQVIVGSPDAGYET